MTPQALCWSECPACQTAVVFGPLDRMHRPTCRRCQRRLPLEGLRSLDAVTWESIDASEALLGAVTLIARPPTPRQVRLLLTATARLRFGPHFIDRRRGAVEAAENWADCGRPGAAVAALRSELHDAAAPLGSAEYNCWQLCRWTLVDRLRLDLSCDLYHPRTEMRAAYAAGVRELFPNPFLPPTRNPDWFTSTVRDLARTMYESRDFSAMPILADALQDAGCDDEQILTHCRANRPHARGCWVLDAILGKE